MHSSRMAFLGLPCMMKSHLMIGAIVNEDRISVNFELYLLQVNSQIWLE